MNSEYRSTRAFMRQDRDNDLLVRLYIQIGLLERECFALSAGVCEHRSGDDHGNPFCLATMTPIRPVYDATQRPINTSHASMDGAGKVTLHLDVAADGDPSNEMASTPMGIL